MATIALALGAWASMGRASTDQFKAADASVAAASAVAATVAPTAAPRPPTAAMFRDRCEASLHMRDAALSIGVCTPFLADAALAGQAHAALAVAHMFKDPPDPTQSAVHAAAAAEVGSVTGSTLLVMHALRGDAGVSMPMERIWATLQRESAMPQLRALHEQVGAAMRCREAAQFRLREQPLFCLLRTEIRAWAKHSGMEPLKADDEGSDRFRVTGLPGVRAMEVAYDRDATTGLHTPASVRYLLDADSEASPALQDIRAALDAKYRRTGGDGMSWSAADGVSVSLRAGRPSMRLHYELPQRVASARRNALALAQQRGKSRVENAKKLL